MTLQVPEKALVLDFSGVIYIDSSGQDAMDELLDIYQEKQVPIIVYGLRQQPRNMLIRTGWLKRNGYGNRCANLDNVKKKLAKIS